MPERGLHFVVRTPAGVVLDEAVTSLRVPSDTGQVGLRPGAEAAALGIEPGLALVRTRAGLRYLATAGGLLRCDGREASLLTPLAVEGESAEGVASKLEAALREPAAERELRLALQRLETGILRELRRPAAERGGRG